MTRVTILCLHANPGVRDPRAAVIWSRFRDALPEGFSDYTYTDGSLEMPFFPTGERCVRRSMPPFVSARACAAADARRAGECRAGDGLRRAVRKESP